MIYIYIEIQKPNCFKDMLHKIHSKSEDLLLFIVQKTPEKMIPGFLVKWMESYTTKRLATLKQEIIRKRWQTMELEKTVDNIHQGQQP